MFGQRKKQGPQRHQYEDANKYVFKCRIRGYFYNDMRYINLRFTYLLTYLLTYLKVDSDDDDVTNDGKLFHA